MVVNVNVNDLISLVKFFMTLLPEGIVPIIVGSVMAIAVFSIAIWYTYEMARTKHLCNEDAYEDVRSKRLDNDKKSLDNQLFEQKHIQAVNHNAGTNTVVNTPETTH